jgi:type I restriction enzyme S subunit
MKSNYKPLGKYIQPVDERNTDLQDLPLMGLSVSKVFFPTIANLVGTDMKTYKIVYRNQFTYIADTSRRGDKIAIALNTEFDKMLVSQAYTPFEIKDTNELLPEYLMMWFRRPEFDRYARFKSHGSAREIFDWDEMCNTLLPVPHPDKQKEIVKEYNIIQNRIALNQQLIEKLEETAQAVYKRWFVEFEFPDAEGKPYKRIRVMEGRWWKVSWAKYRRAGRLDICLT